MSDKNFVLKSDSKTLVRSHLVVAPRYPGKEGVVVRLVDENAAVIGLALSPESTRELAHELLRRIGDPVPKVPERPLGERVGEYVRHIDDGDVRKIVAPGKGVNLKAYDWATAINASGYESQIYNEPSKVWWEPVQVETKVKYLWTVVE